MPRAPRCCARSISTRRERRRGYRRSRPARQGGRSVVRRTRIQRGTPSQGGRSPERERERQAGSGAEAEIAWRRPVRAASTRGHGTFPGRAARIGTRLGSAWKRLGVCRESLCARSRRICAAGSSPGMRRYPARGPSHRRGGRCALCDRARLRLRRCRTARGRRLREPVGHRQRLIRHDAPAPRPACPDLRAALGLHPQLVSERAGKRGIRASGAGFGTASSGASTGTPPARAPSGPG